MDHFPEDFNGFNLRLKNENPVSRIISKYRSQIYDKFKYAQKDHVEIKLGKDFTRDVHQSLEFELRGKQLKSWIEPRTESFIVGGENEPEVEEFHNHYLVIEPDY